MSSKSVAIFFFPLCIFAQFPGPSSGISLSGEIRGLRSGEIDHVYIDLRPLDSAAASDRSTTDSEGHFTFDHIAPGSYRLRVLAQPGGDPIYEEPVEVNAQSGPLTVEIPSRTESKPISGVVSVQQLRRPPSKKALQAFAQAEQYSHSHDTAKAIEKLEQAIRIEPSFREAHLNLGAQYARLGRYQEAMTHIQASIQIGPPDPRAYTNLAFCYLELRQFGDAENYAKKALALDSASRPAQTILRAIPAHGN
ncbi:MAG TPA: tetratricopeptide repeat protein [Bryobacteraceae bacterium]|nr:tetratricopeptide repeat protein [Bryobacteraceae bacterium]